MIPAIKNIGAYVKSVMGIPPTNSDVATTDGASIDRQGYGSCVLHGACGAASGSPTGQTADALLQDSADGSTDWTDLTGAAIAQLVADDTEAEVDVDLSSARRYIRAQVAVTLTAGTTPLLPVSATVTLGGADVLPT